MRQGVADKRQALIFIRHVLTDKRQDVIYRKANLISDFASKVLVFAPLLEQKISPKLFVWGLSLMLLLRLGE